MQWQHVQVRTQHTVHCFTLYPQYPVLSKSSSASAILSFYSILFYSIAHRAALCHSAASITEAMPCRIMLDCSALYYNYPLSHVICTSYRITSYRIIKHHIVSYRIVSQFSNIAVWTEDWIERHCGWDTRRGRGRGIDRALTASVTLTLSPKLRAIYTRPHLFVPISIPSLSSLFHQSLLLFFPLDGFSPPLLSSVF